jgi:hypothetical protein
MKHTVYLPDHLEPILSQLMAIRHVENPGTRPSASAIIADALLVYVTRRVIDYEKTNGVSPSAQKKSKELARLLKKNYGLPFDA